MEEAMKSTATQAQLGVKPAGQQRRRLEAGLRRISIALGDSERREVAGTPNVSAWDGGLVMKTRSVKKGGTEGSCRARVREVGRSPAYP